MSDIKILIGLKKDLEELEKDASDRFHDAKDDEKASFYLGKCSGLMKAIKLIDDLEKSIIEKQD